MLRTALPLLRPSVLVLALSLCAWANTCGDCDDSGSVTVIDALLACQHAVALTTLTGSDFLACDIDISLEVNVLDALVIAMEAQGMPATLTCIPFATFQITEVQFDWSAVVPDGYSLRRNSSTDVLVPEWQLSPTRSEPALFIGGQTPTICFHATVTPATVTSADLRISTGGSVLGDFQTVPVSFVGGSSGTVQIALAGPIPMVLDRHQITFDWHSSNVDGSGSPEQPLTSTGPHTIYTLLGTPTAPWTTSGTREPWTDLLDHICAWAGGQTDAHAALSAMVRPFRENYGMQYDTLWGAPYYSVGAGWDMNLSLMVTRMATASIGTYNCYDAARAVALFGDLIGASQAFWFVDGPSGFFVNCINLNGRGWTNSPFYSADGSPMIRPPDMGPPRWAFGNHGITGPPGSSPPSAVWDGTCSGDGDGNADEPPFLEVDLCNLTYAQYSALVVDDNPFRLTDPPYVISFNFQ